MHPSTDHLTKVRELARLLEEDINVTCEVISIIGEDKCIKLLDLKRHYPLPPWYRLADDKEQDFWNLFTIDDILTRVGELDAKDIELFKKELEEYYPSE